MFRTCSSKWINRIYGLGVGRRRTLARSKSCRHLQLEILEQRLTPAGHGWTGNVNTLWSNPGNWIGGAPAAGETNVSLSFCTPSFHCMAGNLSNTNDIPGLTVQGIDIQAGYTLQGDAITLAGGATINTLFDNTISLGLNLAGTSSLPDVHVFSTDGSLDLGGPITGPASSVLDLAGGTIQLSNSANSFSGSIVVQQGTLQLGAPDAIPPGCAVTVNAGATLDLNGLADEIGSLAGAGKVTLENKGALFTGHDNSSTTFSGVISGTGGVVKEGSGTFTLANSNTYSNGTTIIGGTLQLGVDDAISAASLVSIFQNGTFDLNGKLATIAALQGGSAVTLGVGGILVTGGSNASTTYSGIISGSGNLVKTGTGVFTLSGANTYSGRTNITGGVLRLGANNAIPATSAVTVFVGLFSVYPSATLDLNNFNDTIGSLMEPIFFTGKDFVTLGRGTLTTGADNTSSSFSGVISGTGGLTKTGAGTFALLGHNTYSGVTTLQAGILDVDGSCSNVIINGGTLRGSGSVTSIAASGGTVSPGSFNPGTVHCANTAILASGSAFQVRLNGTANNQFDQLSVGGRMILDGTSTLTVTVNYPAQVGPPPDTFTLITAGAGVSGIFNGLPNLATFTASGQRFQITYKPTSVILTRVAGPVTHFQIDTLGTTQAGAPFDYTVTALDDGNRIVTLFTGTVRFSSQDPYGARLPDNYAFTTGDGADNGVHTFSGGATLFTAGTWDITAAVLSTGATSSALVSVTPAPAVSFAILAPPTSPAGAAFDITLAALDPYGNIDTNFRGTVHFSTSDSDSAVVVPADYTFQASDTGLAAFPGSVTLVTPGDQTLMAADTVSGIDGTVTVTVIGAPIPPPGGGPGRSRGHGPLIVETPRAAVLSAASDPAGGGSVLLAATVVDRVFARAEQALSLAIRGSGHKTLAWTTEGLWDWLGTESSVAV